MHGQWTQKDFLREYENREEHVMLLWQLEMLENLNVST